MKIKKEIFLFILASIFIFTSWIFISHASHSENNEGKQHGLQGSEEHHDMNDQEGNIHEDGAAPIQKHHEEEESRDIPYDEIAFNKSVHSSLPLWLILIPLLGGISLLIFKNREHFGENLLILFTGITFIVSLFLYNPVISGIALSGGIRKGIYYELPFLPKFGFNLTFKIDPICMTLVIFSCLVWFLIALFSKSYMEVEGHRQRYTIANCCCLAVTLGAFMAGDFFTLYIFYEAILIFLYLMVIHREDASALIASKVYLYSGILTGLILLYGIFLLYYFTGSVEIKSLAQLFSTAPLWARYLVAGMLIVGFGGKAGIFLEHIWMPHAYGSAPSLTAALSSGIMIEVGAYGIFRTANMILAPLGTPGSLAQPFSFLWMETSRIGYILIVVGIMTMFFGALNALISNHGLKLLAYSSVSQMGYIIMGIGCAAYMGVDGAMGFAASGYHIINHALFKAALFLCVGAVFYRTKETDIRNLGGLWQNMPTTAVVMLISLCAISGIPGFNGFASKTMLHHSIIEAYEHSIQLMGRPDKWLRVAEVMFIVTAGCTFAYNIKLFSFIFLGKRPEKYENIQPVPLSMKIALAALATFIIFMGLFPNWLLNSFIGPSLSYFGFNPTSHAYHILYNTHAPEGARSALPLLYNPATGAVFSDPEVVHNLAGGSSAIMIGGVIIILGLIFGLFLYQSPKKYTVEYYYRYIFTKFLGLCSLVYRTVVFWGEAIIGKCMVYIWVPPLKMEQIVSNRFEEIMDNQEIWNYIAQLEDEYEKIVPKNPALFSYLTKLNKKYDESIEKPINSRGIFEHISKVDEGLGKYLEKSMGKGLLKTDVFTNVARLDERFSGILDRAMKKKTVFDNVTSADGHFDDLVDKLIFSRIFWGVIARRDSRLLSSDLFKKLINIETVYDTLVDKALFSILGSEDLSKIRMDRKDFSQSWFLNMCKRVAKIHTGDISSYITWIAVALTLIIVFLVGIPYLKTPFAILLSITITIFITTIFAFIFL